MDFLMCFRGHLFLLGKSLISMKRQIYDLRVVLHAKRWNALWYHIWLTVAEDKTSTYLGIRDLRSKAGSPWTAWRVSKAWQGRPTTHPPRTHVHGVGSFFMRLNVWKLMKAQGMQNSGVILERHCSNLFFRIQFWRCEPISKQHNHQEMQHHVAHSEFAGSPVEWWTRILQAW